MVHKKSLNIKQGHLVALALFCFGTINYSFTMSVTDNFQVATWNVLHPKAYQVAIKARKSPSPIPNPPLSESARDALMSVTVSELVLSTDIICFQEFNYDKSGNDIKLFAKKDFSHELVVPKSYQPKMTYGISYGAGVAIAFDKVKFDLVGDPIWKLIKDDDPMHNVLFIKLKSKSTGSIFGIFNVHLPFTSKDFDAVDALGTVISGILLEKKEFTTSDLNYFVICGDFNIDSYKNLAKVNEIKNKPLVSGFSLGEIFEKDVSRITGIGADNATPKHFDYIFYFPGSIWNDLILAEAYTYPELPTDIKKLVRHDQGSKKYEFSSDHAVVFAHFVGTREEKIPVKVVGIVPQVVSPVTRKPSEQEKEAQEERLLALIATMQLKGEKTKKKLTEKLSEVAVETAPEPVPAKPVPPIKAPIKEEPPKPTTQQPKPKKKSTRRRGKKSKKRRTPKKLKKKKKSKKGKKGKGKRGSHAKSKKSKH